MRLLVISLLSAVIVTCHRMSPKVILKWNKLIYKWDSPEQEKEAINSGVYDPGTLGTLYDVDVYVAKDRENISANKIFVTSVREKGVPVSLMTVTNIFDNTSNDPLLYPYPNWKWHLSENCTERITNVYRVDIKCNLLFVLDSGIIDDKKLCPPQVLVFNLDSDELVNKTEIPHHIATNKNGTGLLVTIIVDWCCKDGYNPTVYMADTEGVGLAVWQPYSNAFCRFESDCMKPTDTDFTIDGSSFSLADGILGMTLANQYKKEKDLYYAALSGSKICKMKKSDLTGKCPLSQERTNNITTLVTKLSNQTGPMASKDCAIFFSNVPQTSVLCADIGTGKPIDSSNTVVIAHDPVTLQFISGMKVRKYYEPIYEHNDEHIYEQYLVMLSNRFQYVMTGKRNPNETNFRILILPMDEIKNNTPCFNSCSDDCDRHHDNNHYDRRHGGIYRGHHRDDNYRGHHRDHRHHYYDYRNGYKPYWWFG